MYVCMYVCNTYVNVYCVLISPPIRMYVCIYVYTYVCMIRMYMYVCMYILTYVCIIWSHFFSCMNTYVLFINISPYYSLTYLLSLCRWIPWPKSTWPSRPSNFSRKLVILSTGKFLILADLKIIWITFIRIHNTYFMYANYINTP